LCKNKPVFRMLLKIFLSSEKYFNHLTF
jgi:hypothetical protein